MVSTRPLISKSSSSCTHPLATVPRAPTIINIPSLSWFTFFLFPSKVQVLSFLLACFQFYCVVSRNSKHHFRQIFVLFLFLIFFFFVLFFNFCWLLLGFVVWQDYVIRLYFKIPEEFVGLIFLEIFWVVHITFVRIVKLNFGQSQQMSRFGYSPVKVLHYYHLSFSHQR